jgi:glycosyltransferase involved in cell wall biosynthesis
MLMQQDYPESPTISVIIPARNEARNLEHVLTKIPSIVDEVILIDGHSTDNTIAIAQELLPSIQIVKQKGKGKGDAVRAGVKASTSNIIVMLDADGSADPSEIPDFIEVLLAGNDFAKGSRFVKGGGSHDITIFRRWGNFWLSKLVNLLFRAQFSDLCYGYNAFWKYCFDEVNIDSDGFEVETLINIRMHQARFKIVEVPSFEYARIHGVSNLHAFRDGWRVLKTILRERRRRVSPAPQLTTTFSIEGQPLIPEEVVL